MKTMIFLASLVCSSMAIAGGGSTSSPTIATLAYIGCNDPNFAPHLNPNTLSISLSEVYDTRTLQPIGGKVDFGSPRVAGGGAFLNYIMESPGTFIGAMNNAAQGQLRVTFQSDTAFVTVGEKSGQVTKFQLKCVAFKSNGSAPSRFGWDLVPATVGEALAIIQQ